ncbi:MAG: histidinol-phosphate transaminase [Candidatus Binatia bacterium]
MKPSIPTRIIGLNPYEPGKPIEEVERELGIANCVKLASNENPLGPSPFALRALEAALAEVHRYPDGGAVALTRRLADELAVGVGQLVLGNGSNELIELLTRIFASPGDEVVMSEDAFLIYELVSRAQGAEAVKVPSREFHHDLDAIGAAITPRTRLVFLANPNNPTGTIFRRSEWERFLADTPTRVVLVVDEAYSEFVDDEEFPDTLSCLNTHPGLVVLRTFSKIHGLAGLRVGYGIGPEEIIDAVARLRQPFNVNALAQVAALAALDDHDHLKASRHLVREGRAFYYGALDEIGLEYVESQANFVLVRVGDGAAVTRAMLERGVIVRPMDPYGYPDMVRVTFGTAIENRRCVDALAEICADSIGSGC